MHRFSYLAEPLQILKGRIIGLLLFGSYFLASYLSPFVAVVIMLLLFALMPVMMLGTSSDATDEVMAL